MAHANILVRTGVTPLGRWDALHWALGFESFLRRGWPEARVTIFAEGPERVWDHLYSRVRDLVPLRTGVDLGEEAWARSKRGFADLVLHLAPWSLESDQLGLWRGKARHLVRPTAVAGGHSADEGAVAISSESQAERLVMGRRWLLMDPSVAMARPLRRSPGSTAKAWLVDLRDLACPDQIALARSWSKEPGLEPTWIIPNHWDEGEINQLRQTIPQAKWILESERTSAVSAGADLVVTSSLPSVHEALALGVPVQVLVREAAPCPEIQSLARAHALDWLPWTDAASLATHVLASSMDSDHLRILASRGSELVDGQGTLRLLDLLVPGFSTSRAGQWGAELSAAESALVMA